MAPPIVNFLLGSFGIVAAVLLIGGSIVLRAQKNRHRFELARRAMESGTVLPPPPPLWAGLRRQALSTLALGIGLIVVGGGAWWLGSGAIMPEQSSVATQPVAPPPSPLFGPPGPPPVDYRRDAWHAAQARVTVGQTAIGCGVILTLLGAVRLAAAKAERTGA